MMDKLFLYRSLQLPLQLLLSFTEASAEFKKQSLSRSTDQLVHPRSVQVKARKALDMPAPVDIGSFAYASNSDHTLVLDHTK
jgi:hypothetical protein